MRYVILPAILSAIVAFIGTAAFAQTNAPIVYPAHGQSTEQQARDEAACRAWAHQQTGGPTEMAQWAPRGELVGGAARGAALGAIGGAIGGDAGRGAAIGAGMGAAAGLFRRFRMHREEMAIDQERVHRYYQAFAACMTGRGYSVS